MEFEINNNSQSRMKKNNEYKENKNDEESSEHESIFDIEVNLNPIEKEKEKIGEEKNKVDILKFDLRKKRKREFINEQSVEIIRINKYCNRNNKMLDLLKNIDNNKDIKKADINKLIHLLSIDLIDSKKIRNFKKLISEQKKQFFKKLLNLTKYEYKLFWYNFSNKDYKKCDAKDIKSTNIKKAKKIYDYIINQRNSNDENNNSLISDEKNNVKIKDIIEKRIKREKEIEKMDNEMLKYDPDISESDDDFLFSSSEEDSSQDKKVEKNEYKDREKKEDKNEAKKDIENEEDEQKFIDKEDEIEIFN